jgi:hypothetical protein
MRSPWPFKVRPNGSFRLRIQLPYDGMYWLLADYCPSKATPQLAVQTFFVSGHSALAKPRPGHTAAGLQTWG